MNKPTGEGVEREGGEGEGGGGGGEGGGGGGEVKVVKRTLFQRSNAYPQKKVLTFNRYSNDFPFSVYYNGLEFLSEAERRYEEWCVYIITCRITGYLCDSEICFGPLR